MIDDSTIQSITLIDVAIQTPIVTIPLADAFPIFAITPDGTTAWVTNTSSNTISSVIGLNTATPSFGSSITVGTSPNGIAITPDGKLAYCSML